MTHSALDNPIWSSLSTRHREMARRVGDVAGYPADVAPFASVPAERTSDESEWGALLSAGETAYLLGIAPRLRDGWQLEGFRPLAQMICPAALDVVDGPEIIELTETHRADVLALTARVYPHYFRARTMELGRYFGIYRDGQLAAMAGERLGTDDTQEISAICTHPDYNGRGYARRLTAMLSNDNLERGRLPFLHVSQENTRALRMYEQLGYRLRREIGFWSLMRARSL